jgi:hypothetical protein
MCPEAPNCSRGFTLRVNGADTAVACTISDAQTGCNIGAAKATIPPGSKLSIKTTVPTGTPNTAPDAWIGWRASTP